MPVTTTRLAKALGLHSVTNPFHPLSMASDERALETLDGPPCPERAPADLTSAAQPSPPSGVLGIRDAATAPAPSWIRQYPRGEGTTADRQRWDARSGSGIRSPACRIGRVCDTPSGSASPAPHMWDHRAVTTLPQRRQLYEWKARLGFHGWRHGSAQHWFQFLLRGWWRPRHPSRRRPPLSRQGTP